MNANSFWQLFLETGAPEMYLLYHKARKAEEMNVLESEGPGPAGNSLQ